MRQFIGSRSESTKIPIVSRTSAKSPSILFQQSILAIPASFIGLRKLLAHCFRKLGGHVLFFSNHFGFREDIPKSRWKKLQTIMDKELQGVDSAGSAVL